MTPIRMVFEPPPPAVPPPPPVAPPLHAGRGIARARASAEKHTNPEGLLMDDLPWSAGYQKMRGPRRSGCARFVMVVEPGIEPGRRQGDEVHDSGQGEQRVRSGRHAR